MVAIGDGTVYAGGFCGYMAYSASGGSITNCGYGTPELDGGNIYVEASGDLYAGGFIGYQGNPVRNSYSICDNEFVAYGSANQYTGGFAGRTRGIISQCWSSVNISAYNSGSASEFYTGSIAGYVEAASTIENSYSFPYINVNKDSGSGSVYSGGIAGYSAGIITKCFSNGWVLSNSDLSTDNVCVGGIAGRVSGGRIESNLVFTLSSQTRISATGGAYAESGRIYGDASGSPVISKNYGLDTMTIIPSPGSIIPSDPTGQHGESIAFIDLLDSRFWLDPDGLAFNKGTNNYIQNIWNFNSLAGQGYPRLAWEGN